jgi:para-nitrobenzyl esterase
MTTVETSLGRIEGTFDNGLHVFKGIPYAMPPVADRRWQPPAVHEGWTGVLAATQFGNMSVQPPPVPMDVLADYGGVGIGEDCLSLNVWSPGIEGAHRPVMVWIHGGGFSLGAASHTITHGQNLASRGDVVVVTVNYRLGALGFLNLNEVTKGRIPATGNEGLLDQVCALQWVRDNIHQFGGDADNVTIFGQSAGAMSCGALLALESARGLFHKAILQSGAASTACSLGRATTVAECVASHAGITRINDASAWLETSADQLLAAGTAASMELGMMLFQPCIDGSVLPCLPIESIANGSADGISVMTGSTMHESRVMVMPNPATEKLSFDDIAEKLKSISDSSVDRETMIAAYREIAARNGKDEDARSIYAAILSDQTFRQPGIRLAEVMAVRGQPVYQYLFTAESPYFGGSLRSCHSMEVAYVFDTHSIGEPQKAFFGCGPEADLLAATVQDAWIGFARTGNPNGDLLSGWDVYDTATRSTGILGHPSAIDSAPMEAERRAWQRFEDGQVIGTFFL